jgi:hypothetical protein
MNDFRGHLYMWGIYLGILWIGPEFLSAQEKSANEPGTVEPYHRVVLLSLPDTTPNPEDVVFKTISNESPLIVPYGKNFILTDVLYSSEVDFLITSTARLPLVTGDIRLSATTGSSSSGSIEAPDGFIFENVSIPGSNTTTDSLEITFSTISASHMQHISFKTGIPFPAGARISPGTTPLTTRLPDHLSLIGFLKSPEPSLSRSEVEKLLQDVLNKK